MENMNKRKQKLIDRAFQYRLILQFALINALIMMLFGCVFYLFVDSELSTSLAKAHVTYQNLADLLFPIVLTLSMFHILLSTVIIAGVVLYASHKIAGPLYRINQALKEVTSKNLQPFTKVRAGDQVKELAATVSELADSFRNDIQLMRKYVESALELASDQEQQKKLESLLALLDEYRS